MKFLAFYMLTNLRVCLPVKKRSRQNSPLIITENFSPVSFLLLKSKKSYTTWGKYVIIGVQRIHTVYAIHHRYSLRLRTSLSLCVVYVRPKRTNGRTDGRAGRETDGTREEEECWSCCCRCCVAREV